jgi:hypothetical protein
MSPLYKKRRHKRGELEYDQNCAAEHQSKMHNDGGNIAPILKPTTAENLPYQREFCSLRLFF